MWGLSKTRRYVESGLRTRYAFAILLLAGLVIVICNETIFAHSRATLTRGIQLTDLRITAAHALQLLTDAQSAAGGYMATGNEHHLKQYEKARSKLLETQQESFLLVSQMDGDGEIPLGEVKSLTDDVLKHMQLGLLQKSQGTVDPLVLVNWYDARMKKNMALRAAFDQTLQKAASVQHGARVSIYDAMTLSRWALNCLVGLSVAGLYFWIRQLQQNDAMREGEKKRLAEQVNQRTSELRELAGYLVNAREDERRRVARELHDDLGGLLTATKLDIARIKRQDGLSASVVERFASIERRINEGISLKRKLIEKLRPSALDQLGLVPSVEMLCADMSAVMEIPIAVDLQAAVLADEVALTIYRVVQESLTNAAKYARAKSVRVQLNTQGDDLQLTIVDDGRGFVPDNVGHGHHGLLGLRYRVESHGGEFSVTSAPDRGTEVRVRLPLVTPMVS